MVKAYLKRKSSSEAGVWLRSRQIAVVTFEPGAKTGGPYFAWHLDGSPIGDAATATAAAELARLAIAPEGEQ